jgi:hypothetical protein
MSTLFICALEVGVSLFLLSHLGFWLQTQLKWDTAFLWLCIPIVGFLLAIINVHYPAPPKTETVCNGVLITVESR